MREREDGFTLIELMITVMIIGILISISIPFFLGTRSRAYDADAKSGVTHALQAGRVLYSDDETYATATPATLHAVEPALTFVDAATPSDGPKTVSQDSPDALTTGKTLVVAVFSLSGTCFFMRDNGDVGVSYAEMTVTSSNCKASNTGSLVFGPTW